MQMVCDTKPCEKKHGTAKRIVESCMKSLRGYEKHLLTRMLYSDIEEQRSHEPARWHLTLNEKSEATCAWLSVRNGMPLVWRDASTIRCCRVLALSEDAGRVVATVTTCLLRRELSIGIYEWTVGQEAAQVVLVASPRTWWPAMYWKCTGDALLTLW